jgi:hypothetical protein
MIKTKLKSKNKIIFYFLAFTITFLFLVTVAGLDDIVCKKGEHPIINLLNRLQVFDLKTIIFGFLAFGIFGYVAIGSFLLISLFTFFIISKLDSNLRQIKWSESNYLTPEVRKWMDVALSTFFLTVLSTMAGFIVISFIHAYRY